MGIRRNYYFDVEVKQAGQPRPYADSEYEYEIVSTRPEHEVKAFCTKILRPCSQTFKEWSENKNSAASYFAGYYVFEKTGDNTYRYFKKEPFAD